jgi:predicted permease
MTASGLLLVLACLNVAGLVVARTLQRRRDTALRLALGASRWLIVRGQTVELALLAAPSACLGLLASGPLLDRTVPLLPDSMALLKTPAIDLRVMAAATISAVLSLCVLTLWAARISGRLACALGAWRSSSSAVHARSGRFALAGLVGLGFVLVAAASLTSASLASAWAEDNGYARDRLALIEAYASFYDTPAEAVDQLESVRARLTGTPGVEEVAVASIQPLFESESVSRGGGAPEPDTIVTRLVTSNYFRVLGLELVEGSWPRADEWTRDARVAIISQSAAGAWFPGARAVGGEIDGSTIGLPEGSTPLNVVGVVRDARYIALDQAPMRDVYRPGPIAVGTYGVFFVVRTTEAADALVPEFLRVTSDHRMTVTQAITIRDALYRSVRARAFSAWLFGLLGTSGVGILAIGIFGTLASEADRRRREIGIRTAFGASAPRVVRQFVLEQAPWVGGGLLAGAVVTFWAAAFIESRLYGVSAREPALLFLTAIVVLSTALCGIVVPALRAARVDPVVALRAEG